jgi:hypothetical protein
MRYESHLAIRRSVIYTALDSASQIRDLINLALQHPRLHFLTCGKECSWLLAVGYMQDAIFPSTRMQADESFNYRGGIFASRICCCELIETRLVAYRVASREMRRRIESINELTREVIRRRYRSAPKSMSWGDE